jgi:uncharacterized protein
MSFRVVFDTNVLFSAIGWQGKPAECVGLVQSQKIQGITCVELLNELAEKLSIKLGFTEEQIAVILASFGTLFEVITISGALTGLQPDPDDDIVLECAVVGKATHIVTGDQKHLLPLKSFQDIQILTPAELLAAVSLA